MNKDSQPKRTGDNSTKEAIQPFPPSEWFQPASICIRDFGTCNVLVVAPHGYPGNDRNTELLSYHLAEALDSYAVINSGKYRRPDNSEKPDPEKRVLDLNKPEQAGMARSDYLDPMLDLVNEMRRVYSKPPIVILVHGMMNKTAAEKVGLHTGDPAAVFALGAGYAADYQRTHPPIPDAYTECYDAGTATASIEFVAGMLKALRTNLGPGGDGVPGFGAVKSLPIIFKKECDFPVEAVQLELKWTGFRDTSENIVNASEKLAKALLGLTALTRSSGLCSNA
jgi:hypothetical protein